MSNFEMFEDNYKGLESEPISDEDELEEEVGYEDEDDAVPHESMDDNDQW